ASDPSSATVFPRAPVNLRVTGVGIDHIDLSWRNASTIATEFFVEENVPGSGFQEIPGSRGGPGTTFSHRNLIEGTRHEYRVRAFLSGVENSRHQEVDSVPSLSVSATTLAFTTVFTAPSGTLINEGNNAGFCLVQRLSQQLLTPTGTTPNQVRIRLRGPLTGSLTIDRVTISKAATGGDPYDSDASDLTVIVPSTAFPSGVTIAANTTQTVVGNYTIDFNSDLVIAFDISSTSGQGNVIFGALPAPLTGADAYSNPGTAEAGVADRRPNNQNPAIYQNTALNTLALIETIEVL